MTKTSKVLRQGASGAIIAAVLLCLLHFFPAKAGLANQSGDWQVCFSPEGHCATLILDEIGAARTSIRVQAYSFTARDIAEALAAAQARGVDVQVIVDKSQTGERYTVLDRLAAAGVPTFVDHCCAIAHNKVIVIDEATVVTGSYNFTQAAESKNAENLLVLKDPVLARRYLDNWRHHEQGAERFVAR